MIKDAMMTHRGICFFSLSHARCALPYVLCDVRAIALSFLRVCRRGQEQTVQSSRRVSGEIGDTQAALGMFQGVKRT